MRANERAKLLVEHPASNNLTSQWIRTIEHDYAFSMLVTRLENIVERRKIGRVAHSNILQVDHQRFDTGEHVGGRHSRFAVETVNRETGHTIRFGVNVIACLDLSTNTVFGAE
jgi:hypothetical protein